MLSRRDFLKLIAVSLGSAMASACERDTPTPTLPTATPRPTRTATTIRTRMPTMTPTPSSTPTATPITFDLVTVRGDQFYWRGERFLVKGFNYYPRVRPWRTFNIGEWEPRVTERELRLGVDLGANVVRAFVDYNFSITNKTPTPLPTGLTTAPASSRTRTLTPTPTPTLTFLAPMPQYIKNVREFLDIAGRLNLKVILTLFDSLDWAIYEPQNHWIAEEYLKVFLPPFVNDSRIMCWDLQNEPDKAIRTVGADKVIPFFKRLALLTRSIDPNHLRTVGWIDRARAQYFPDLNDDLDFWCFHYYDTVDRLDELVKFYKTQTTKPVLLEEFGLPTGGPPPEGRYTELDQFTHYSTVFSILEDNKMCDSVFWCLNDYPIGLAGNPPLQTDSPENHFGVFRLDYSEKLVALAIRRFWKNSEK